MTAIKIMPCLDMKEGRVVKGIHFVGKQVNKRDVVEN
jgi:cyclase